MSNKLLESVQCKLVKCHLKFCRPQPREQRQQKQQTRLGGLLGLAHTEDADAADEGQKPHNVDWVRHLKICEEGEYR